MRQRVVGEEGLVVVEPDEAVAFAVVEAPADGADRRIDDPDGEEDERRREERGGDAVSLPETALVGLGRRPRRGSLRPSVLRRSFAYW